MTVYGLLNAIVERMCRTGRVLVTTPYAYSLGNCAEEIYFALLKARREQKQVRFLYPRRLFWKVRVHVANHALFRVVSDYAAPNEGACDRVAGAALTVLFFCLRQLYLRPRSAFAWLRRRLGRPGESRNNVYYVVPSIGRRGLWKPDDARQFDWSVVETLDWRDQLERHVPVQLCAEDVRRAEDVRAALGLPQHAWFACLHVREGGYHGDWQTGVHRNTSIQSYVQGIEAITEAGGYVVRLGDPTMTPLTGLDRTIDYARSPLKSELMDVYLIGACRFFVGVNSGPLDVAFLFQKPVVLTNLTNWSISYPKRPGDLAILKHVYSRSRGRFLSLQELLHEPFDCQCVRHIDADYRMVDDSAEEIRDVIVEFLHGSGGRHTEGAGLQLAFNRGRSAQIRRWLIGPGVFWSHDRDEDVAERYRFAPCAFAAGALGRRFLEDNWHESSRNQTEAVARSAGSMH
jgi:putative glycosyltransferase (TIGR04372 family)